MKTWVAFLLGLGMVVISAGEAWSGTPYSPQEIKAVETADEAKIRNLRDQEITQLRIVLGRRAGSNRRADLYFRLAEIHLEAYRSEFLLEGRAHEKRLEKKIPDKFIDHSHSRPHIDAGIRACQEVIGFRIPFDKLDQIYYFLAFYYGELGDRKKSSSYYQHLAQTYPNSNFAGIANKELGDYYYGLAQYHPAAGYFEIALRKVTPETTPPILHKLAWCYYRMKGYDRAIATMKEAIAKAIQFKRYLPMKDEALRDMATLMTERGRVQEAIVYFQSVAGDEKLFPGILEKLGRQYERNVETAKATEVYETVLKILPQSESAFRSRVKLVELDIRAGRFLEALQRLKGVAIPSSGEAETLAVSKNLKILIRKIATEHHHRHRQQGVEKDLGIAEAYYSTYVDRYLKQDDPHQELAEIQMYLADVKRNLKKFKEATDLYREILESSQAGAKRYAREAGTLWRESLLELMKKEPHKPGTVAPSEVEKEFIQASDLLQKSLEDSPAGTRQAREIALRSTLVLAGYPQTHPEALTRIQTLISRWPNSIQALTAAQLQLQMALEHSSGNQVGGQTGSQGDSPSRGSKSAGIPELQKVLDQLSGNAELMTADQNLQKGKLAAALDQQTTRLKVVRIGQLEKAQEYFTAAKEYEAIALEIPQRELAEKAYRNALESYLKLPLWDSTVTDAMVQLAGTWKGRYPGSPLAIESFKTAATQALVRGDFILTTRIFEKIGTEFKNPESLETAAHLAEAAGDSVGAQRIWSRYLDLYKNSSQRWAITLSLARSQERAHLDTEASLSYKNCALGPDAFAAECNSRRADLYLKNRDIQQAKSLFKKVAGMIPRGSEVVAKTSKKSGGPTSISPFVGYARFKIAELMQKETFFEPMTLPEAQLQKGLGQRLAFLEPLSQADQSVVQVGGPWAIAGLDQLATWAYQFADDVDAIAPPPQAKGDAIEKFHKDLSSVSQPLREKAKSTWNDAYLKAMQLDILSPALPLVAEHLADFGIRSPSRAQGPRGQMHLAGLGAEVQDSSKKNQLLSGVRSRLLKNAKDSLAWTEYGNLIEGEGKPLMARVFYERALVLNPKNALALNNMGVVKIQSEGEEDWIAVSEAAHFFSQALQVDEFFIPSKINLATLMNYYRMFPKAKTLWEQVLVRKTTPDVWDGLAVANQGIGNSTEAVIQFKKASDLGASRDRFAVVFQEAARFAQKKKAGAGDCLSSLGDLSSGSLEGFEKYSVETLKGKCDLWKKLN